MRRAATWSGWFGGLFVLWLFLVGTVQNLELVAGLCAAAIGATAAEIALALGPMRFRLEWRWLHRGWPPLVRVVPEFALLLVALFRRPQGTFRELEFPTGGERAVDVGRRAFAVFAGSLSPNRIVIDVDPETGQAVVHDLLPGASSSELP
jgi:hypothetical protein